MKGKPRKKGRPATTGIGRPINLCTGLDFRAAVYRYIKDSGIVGMSASMAIMSLATQRLKELGKWKDGSNDNEDLP